MGTQNANEGSAVASRLAEADEFEPVEFDGTAVGREDAGDEIEEGRLARPARAAQGDLRLRLQLELRHVHDHVRAALRCGVGFLQVANLQQRHGGSISHAALD